MVLIITVCLVLIGNRGDKMGHTKNKQGDYTFIIFYSSETWKIPQGIEQVDFAVINGGDYGDSGRIGSIDSLNHAQGGQGGGGGAMLEQYNYSVANMSNIAIVIGSGGNYSSFNGKRPSSRNNNNGGRGAEVKYYQGNYGSVYHRGSTNAGSGGYVTCKLNNVRYGGGGGGGGAQHYSTFNSNQSWSASSSSGIYGGGGGSYSKNVKGFNGQNGTGGGGGGGYGRAYQHHTSVSLATENESTGGGQGGSGVVIVRYIAPKLDNSIMFGMNF